MLRYHECGRAIWVQKTWDGVKHYRVYYDPASKKHLTRCPTCDESLRGAVLHTRPPVEPPSETTWLWSRVREELGEERANELRSEWFQRQENGQHESRPC